MGNEYETKVADQDATIQSLMKKKCGECSRLAQELKTLETKCQCARYRRERNKSETKWESHQKVCAGTGSCKKCDTKWDNHKCFGSDRCKKCQIMKLQVENLEKERKKLQVLVYNQGSGFDSCK